MAGNKENEDKDKDEDEDEDETKDKEEDDNDVPSAKRHKESSMSLISPEDMVSQISQLLFPNSPTLQI